MGDTGFTHVLPQKINHKKKTRVKQQYVMKMDTCFKIVFN